MAMRQINKDNWSPRPLLSRDGRSYTPGSYREERELIASGYRLALIDDGGPLSAADIQIDPATAAPECAAADEAAVAVLADEKPAEAPKTKTTRRTTGGAQ